MNPFSQKEVDSLCARVDMDSLPGLVCRQKSQRKDQRVSRGVSGAETLPSSVLPDQGRQEFSPESGGRRLIRTTSLEMMRSCPQHLGGSALDPLGCGEGTGSQTGRVVSPGPCHQVSAPGSALCSHSSHPKQTSTSQLFEKSENLQVATEPRPRSAAPKPDVWTTRKPSVHVCHVSAEAIPGEPGSRARLQGLRRHWSRRWPLPPRPHLGKVLPQASRTLEPASRPHLAPTQGPMPEVPRVVCAPLSPS